MKTLMIWIVIVAATIQSTNAQIRKNTGTQYGIAISQFISGSGFQPGYEAHFTVQPSSKAKVGFGLFFDNETKKFSGITITHQRMLMANRRKLPVIQPFVFYNFIYRRTSMPELKLTDEGITPSGDWVSYASMEHHLGLGLNVNVSEKIKLNLNYGYGLYLGSIKRPSAPDPITSEITGTSGNGFILKTGLGFMF
jgi:hypothetical protein